MQSMNAAVDLDKKEAGDVAQAFLRRTTWPEPGSTDPAAPRRRGRVARADRPRPKWFIHHEDARPIASGSAHDAEASTDHR
jgi:hypothetical protein